MGREVLLFLRGDIKVVLCVNENSLTGRKKLMLGGRIVIITELKPLKRWMINRAQRRSWW